jgi:hypothetical protein
VIKRLLLPAFVGVATAVGCSSSSAGPTCTPFQADTGDFAGYHAWPLTTSFNSPAIPSSPHTSGPRSIYLNQAPPSGATEFPVGTIIVKDIGPGPATADVTLAMVKDGCGFNADGAAGWEWYDLQNNSDGSTSIVWHGAEPPAGSTYAGDPTSCNTCHAQAASNDYVETWPLLSSF